MAETHVALITPWQRQGGIARYADRFADALEAAGAEVTPVPVERSDAANPLAFVELASAVSDDTDVIHVQFEAGLFGRLGMTGVGAPALFLALSRLDCPLITTLHEVHDTHPHWGTVGDRLLRARDWVIERLSLSVSETVVVHTEQARRTLRDRHGDRGQIERLLHPTETDVDPIPNDQAKTDLGLEGPVLLTFGFVEHKKRYQDVIRALPDLPEVTYLVVGGDREGEGTEIRQECESLAAALSVADRVRFTGYIDDDDVPRVFSAADAVVLPYGRVSQSGVINDALAYRRPVVASSLPAFEELRSEFECLLTYDDAADLSETLHQVLYDESTRERLRERAAAYTDTVTWSRFAARSLDLYNRVR